MRIHGKRRQEIPQRQNLAQVVRQSAPQEEEKEEHSSRGVMKTHLGLVAVLALGGCSGSSGMSLSFQRTIPKNATMIKLRSDLGPRDLFAQTTTLLAEQGYSFVHIDSSAFTLDTDGMPIGVSKSPLRLAVRVNSDERGSTLEATGQTLLGPGAWGPAANNSDPKSRRGFEEMTLLLGQLPNREIGYLGK